MNAKMDQTIVPTMQFVSTPMVVLNVVVKKDSKVMGNCALILMNVSGGFPNSHFQLAF